MYIVRSAKLNNLSLRKRTLISNLFDLTKTIFEFIETQVYSIQIGSIRLKTNCLLFLSRFSLNTPKAYFFFGPFTLDFADSLSIISKTQHVRS